MQNAKLVSTPLAAHFKLSATLSPKTDDERDYRSLVPYSSVVGSLMYAMVCSRPYLSYGVSTVSRYMKNPDKEIGKQFSGFSDTCMNLLMFVCSLGEIEINTHDNPGDMMTKILPSAKFEHCLDLVSVSCLDVPLGAFVEDIESLS
ncbi:hypothetical protein CQW23_15190 [Capsicum baccatum]|uniref:Retrovirus-related Pol polyprotein from transposon TNT 1-94 n=1 Tax=Capsicum baccatum TaxID=33114 RepID=A0A2G2WLC6_CAPBA|nr:hypothetical protein CQW23_15190 [Capsicum baccatum]